MAQELIVIEKPELPSEWNYDESVKKVQQLIYKWKNLTQDLFDELWVAKTKLSNPGARTDLATNGARLTWSNYCLDIGSHRNTIDRWLKQWEELKKRAETPALPKSPFTVIYADPPWEYDFSKSKSRAIESKYPTKEIKSIKDMEVPSDKDAVLFLWATAPKLLEALETLESWGFKYVTHGIWDKEIIGMGYWFRGQHELLLIGIRGNVHPAEPGLRKPSIYKERRGKHSQKPDKYREYIDLMFPNCNKIELFARTKRKGWEAWGDEIS